MQIDQAVAGALLAALTPAGVKAALQAAEALEQDHDAALNQWRLQVERARYQADRAERRYRQVEPEHRLVARGLERDWENALARARQGRSRARAARATTPAHADRRTSASSCSRSAPTSAACGPRRRPPTATANSSCARLIEEVILDVNREQRRATAHDPLEGRRDHRARRPAAAATSPRSAPTRTRSR